jgi:hypothetical protein
VRINPSLTARLRIGFVLLFALLLAVSLLGVGRLFQIRVDYEDEVTQFYELELQGERLRSAFILEQATIRSPGPDQSPNPADLNAAAESFESAAARADELAGADAVLSDDVDGGEVARGRRAPDGARQGPTGAGGATAHEPRHRRGREALERHA